MNSILNFGAIGDGKCDDTIPIMLAEQSTDSKIDLQGLTLLALLPTDYIKKTYLNGTIIFEKP